MKLFFKILIGLIAVLIFLSTTITHKFGPYIGKVVDAETGNPLEGTAVHLSFYTQFGTPGGAASNYAGAIECLTDKNGEFNLSKRITKIRMLSLWFPAPDVTIFKPGYGVYPGHQGSSIDPKPEHKWSRIDENRYCVVRLPKLETDAERRETLSTVGPLVPIEDQKLIRTLENQERIYFGLKPYKN